MLSDLSSFRFKASLVIHVTIYGLSDILDTEYILYISTQSLIACFPPTVAAATIEGALLSSSPLAQQ